MAKRIVQMLVTCAVETDRTRDDVRIEVAEALTIVADEVLVELVGSQAHGRVASTFTEQEG